MSKIQEYRSKKFPEKILQVHIVQNLYNDRIMYRFVDAQFNVGAVFLKLQGIEIKNEFKDIEKEELDRQLKEYGWKKIRKRND
jgi:hypothetical protein